MSNLQSEKNIGESEEIRSDSLKDKNNKVDNNFDALKKIKDFFSIQEVIKNEIEVKYKKIVLEGVDLSIFSFVHNKDSVKIEMELTDGISTNFYLNEEKMNFIINKDSNVEFDCEMLFINFDESNYFDIYFKDGTTGLLIKSKDNRWTGNSRKFSIYHLLRIDRKSVEVSIW